MPDWILVDGESFVLYASKCIGISRLSVSKVEELKGSTEGKHFVITYTLPLNNHEIPTHALIDCGATGIAIMDQDFAHHLQIPLRKLNQNQFVEVINGRPIESGDITYIAKVSMKKQDHGEQLPMFITYIRTLSNRPRNSMATIT
jgi:hypothetical protein